MFVFEDKAVLEEGVRRWADADVDDSSYFPEFEQYTHALAEEDHPTCNVLVPKLKTGGKLTGILVVI